MTDLFTSRPPTTTQVQKQTLGLWVGDDLAGVADLLLDHPTPGVNYLGLLQIRTDHQGTGLAVY